MATNNNIVEDVLKRSTKACITEHVFCYVSTRSYAE